MARGVMKVSLPKRKLEEFFFAVIDHVEPEADIPLAITSLEREQRQQ